MYVERRGVGRGPDLLGVLFPLVPRLYHCLLLLLCKRGRLFPLWFHCYVRFFCDYGRRGCLPGGTTLYYLSGSHRLPLFDYGRRGR